MESTRRVPKAVDRYVEAVREVEALRQAVKDDGEPRTEAIRLAVVRRVEAERLLNGGQLGHARRILAGLRSSVAFAPAEVSS